jgi:hypothetical protein
MQRSQPCTTGPFSWPLWTSHDLHTLHRGRQPRGASGHTASCPSSHRRYATQCGRQQAGALGAPRSTPAGLCAAQGPMSMPPRPCRPRPRGPARTNACRGAPPQHPAAMRPCGPGGCLRGPPARLDAVDQPTALPSKHLLARDACMHACRREGSGGCTAQQGPRARAAPAAAAPAPPGLRGSGAPPAAHASAPPQQRGRGAGRAASPREARAPRGGASPARAPRCGAGAPPRPARRVTTPAERTGTPRARARTGPPAGAGGPGGRREP